MRQGKIDCLGGTIKTSLTRKANKDLRVNLLASATAKGCPKYYDKLYVRALNTDDGREFWVMTSDLKVPQRRVNGQISKGTPKIENIQIAKYQSDAPLESSRSFTWTIRSKTNRNMLVIIIRKFDLFAEVFHPETKEIFTVEKKDVTIF